jgi:hypothetical protein
MLFGQRPPTCPGDRPAGDDLPERYAKRATAVMVSVFLFIRDGEKKEDQGQLDVENGRPARDETIVSPCPVSASTRRMRLAVTTPRTPRPGRRG